MHSTRPCLAPTTSTAVKPSSRTHVPLTTLPANQLPEKVRAVSEVVEVVIVVDSATVTSPRLTTIPMATSQEISLPLPTRPRKLPTTPSAADTILSTVAPSVVTTCVRSPFRSITSVALLEATLDTLRECPLPKATCQNIMATSLQVLWHISQAWNRLSWFP